MKKNGEGMVSLTHNSSISDRQVGRKGRRGSSSLYQPVEAKESLVEVEHKTSKVRRENCGSEEGGISVWLGT